MSPSLSGSAPSRPVSILPEGIRRSDVDRLITWVFGPGRLTRAAERAREMARGETAHAFVALREETLLGAVRTTPVRIGETDALLLGPLVMVPTERGRGTGVVLLRAVEAAAWADGERAIVLVGDAPYYARAGYARVSGPIIFPRPVDPVRVLGLDLVPGTIARLEGVLTARR